MSHSRAGHLVARFVGTLRSRPPTPADLAWVASVLRPTELELWMRHTPVDRSHTIAVARTVEDNLPDPDPDALAAALLHDIGKTEASLGTAGRVIATLADMALGPRIRRLDGRRGFLGELGAYSMYPMRGGELLRAAGCSALVVAWAAEHHEPVADWSVDHDLGIILRDADNAAS